MTFKSIPAVFEGAREYIDNPRALEEAHATFNEKALYTQIAAAARCWYENTHRAAHILDLCSATGLCALKVSEAIPVASITLVDLDQYALNIGAGYSYGIDAVSVCCADAISFQSGQQYDLILMNSAYHHIVDEQKEDFLTNARKLMKHDSLILIGEHFLPLYHDGESFRESVVEFYEALVEELNRQHEPRSAVNVIRRSGLYCWEGEYEYKVSWEVFASHIAAAGLRLVDHHVVWQHGTAGNGIPPVGTIAVVLRSGTPETGDVSCEPRGANQTNCY